MRKRRGLNFSTPALWGLWNFPEHPDFVGLFYVALINSVSSSLAVNSCVSQEQVCAHTRVTLASVRTFPQTLRNEKYWPVQTLPSLEGPLQTLFLFHIALKRNLFCFFILISLVFKSCFIIVWSPMVGIVSLATSQEIIYILLIAKFTSLKFPRQIVSLLNPTLCKYFRT